MGAWKQKWNKIEQSSTHGTRHLDDKTNATCACPTIPPITVRVISNNKNNSNDSMVILVVMAAIVIVILITNINSK